MAKRVRFTVSKALAWWNFKAAERGDAQMSINELARRCEVAATTIHRFFREEGDPKAASSLTLDLASKIVNVLDCGIDELMEVIEVEED